MNKRFTDQYIKNLKPSDYVLRFRDGIDDPDLKGFGLSVAPAGTKTFFLNFTSPESGNRRFINLGSYPSTTLSEARKQAREHRYLVRLGHDPIEKKRREIEETQDEKAVGSVDKLFSIYLEDMTIKGKRSADTTRNMWQLDIAPHLSGMRACDVTKDDILNVLSPIVERGAMTKANNTRAMLSAAFNFGLNITGDTRWRNKTPDFRLTHNPVALTKRPGKSNVGQRNLSKLEVKTLWNSIGVEAMHASLALAIKLILATGQRVEEVLQAEWSEFDLDENVWAIPAARRKMRDIQTEPHLVPLTELHAELLNEIRRFSGSSRWLFPHQSGKKPRTCDSLSQAVKRYCCPEGESTRQPFLSFTPRDLRRTWKTLAGSIGIDLEIRNRIQGHSFQGVGSRNYDRYDYMQEKRRDMEKWSKFLENMI